MIKPFGTEGDAALGKVQSKIASLRPSQAAPRRLINIHRRPPKSLCVEVAEIRLHLPCPDGAKVGMTTKRRIALVTTLNPGNGRRLMV
jgi:hypothetical protein